MEISLTVRYNAILLELCVQCIAFKDFADTDSSEFPYIHISGIDTLNLFTEPDVMAYTCNTN